MPLRCRAGIDRGPAHAIANEAALKFKETCGLHAEAYSGAEILHGPAALVRRGFPVIALIARDAAEPAMAATVSRLAAQGGKVLPNGRMVHDLYLFEVKKPSESKKPWDYYKQLAVVPGDKAFPPAKDSGCPLTK